MTSKVASLAGAIAVLVLLGWLYFPGHTFLHSDTQIYLPILERLRDPALYPEDPVALRPHVSYTIYDEVALLGRRITGAEFQLVLVAQQLLFRACGLLGVFLIGRALGLSAMLSLLVASVYGLGATIGGPSVLILEYEPVPRGFAGPLLILCIGLAAHSKWLWAGAACGVAMLYHPPTTLPWLAVLSLLAFRGWRDADRHARFGALALVVLSAALVFVLSRVQAGASESQDFFSRIDPELEKLQRLRGSYNWVSMWSAQWIRHHEFLGLVCLAAWLRLRAAAPEPLRWTMIAMPVFGLATMPISYLLLEHWKWSLMPQLQPMRAVLFVAVFASIGSAAAGVKAAHAGRRWEALAWWLVAFAIPAQADVLQLLLPDLRDSVMRLRWLVVAALAAFATAATHWETARPRMAAAFCAAAMLLPFWAMPGPARVRNYANLDEPELIELGGWARANTSKDAVFLFPQHGRDLQPGLFRVHALRGLYVDWKAGGQANLLKEFAMDWWQRWQRAMELKFDPAKLEPYRALGIDYLVLKTGTKVEGRPAAYENGRYVVYQLD